MSHEEVVKGRAKPLQGELMVDAYCTFILCNGLQNSTCCSMTVTTENSVFPAWVYHVRISHWDVNPYLTPCYSSTCPSTALWGITPVEHSLAVQNKPQPQCDLDPSTVWIQVFPMKYIATHTSWFESGAQSLEKMVFYSLWGMGGKYMSYLIDFHFFLSWLHCKVLLIWTKHFASCSAFTCFVLTIIWTANTSPHGGRGLCQ